MIKELCYKNKSLKVNSMGGELKSFKVDDVEYIWYSMPEYWSFCAPVLFPIVGTLKDKKTNIDGKWYNIPQHGIIRRKEFRLLKETTNSITFYDSFDDETLKLYPFKYQIEITHQINDDSLTTSIKVINKDTKPMPFNIGGHPAFNVPLYDGEKFNDYRIEFETNENIKSCKVMNNATLNFNEIVMEKNNIKSLQLDKSLFDIDTIIINNIKSKKVKLLNKQNKGLEFTFDDFSTLAIWTPYNDAPFVCLEPWIGYNDRYDSNGDFYTKDDLVILKDNQEFNVSYTIKPITE